MIIKKSIFIFFIFAALGMGSRAEAAPAVNSWPIFASYAAGLPVTGTRYLPPIGYPGNSGTEARHQYKVRGNYTLAKLWIRVLSNTTIAESYVRSRKNGANGGQLITIPAGQVGVFADDSGSVNAH